jgi:hypothetical protein
MREYEAIGEMQYPQGDCSTYINRPVLRLHIPLALSIEAAYFVWYSILRLHIHFDSMEKLQSKVLRSYDIVHKANNALEVERNLFMKIKIFSAAYSLIADKDFTVYYNLNTGSLKIVFSLSRLKVKKGLQHLSYV